MEEGLKPVPEGEAIGTEVDTPDGYAGGAPEDPFDDPVAPKATGGNDIFFRLGPWGRIRWLYSNDIPKFILFASATALGIYFIGRFFAYILYYLGNSVLNNAHADEAASHASSRSLSDPLTLTCLAFAGIALLSGVFMWIRGNDKRSVQGFELVKGIGSGAFGFLAGKGS